jgi:hypothetical protein
MSIEIEEDETYKIRQTGGSFTFGTVTEINDDGTYSWESDHPEATGTHWAREDQFVCKVAAGTYLGDDGKPHR